MAGARELCAAAIPRPSAHAAEPVRRAPPGDHQTHHVARSATACATAGAATPPVSARSPPRTSSDAKVERDDVPAVQRHVQQGEHDRCRGQGDERAACLVEGVEQRAPQDDLLGGRDEHRDSHPGEERGGRLEWEPWARPACREGQHDECRPAHEPDRERPGDPHERARREEPRAPARDGCRRQQKRPEGRADCDPVRGAADGRRPARADRPAENSVMRAARAAGEPTSRDGRASRGVAIVASGPCAGRTNAARASVLCIRLTRRARVCVECTLRPGRRPAMARAGPGTARRGGAGSETVEFVPGMDDLDRQGRRLPRGGQDRAFDAHGTGCDGWTAGEVGWPGDVIGPAARSRSSPSRRSAARRTYRTGRPATAR